MFLKETRLLGLILCCMLSCRYSPSNIKFMHRIAEIQDVYQYQYQYFNSYKTFRDQLKDSLQLYEKELLRNYWHLNHGPWEIDSTIYFNRDSTRFITNINRNQVIRNMTSDDLYELYGFKLDERWYILAGSSTQAPRYYYTKDINKPLSMDKLGFLAKENVLSGYVIKREEEFIINDRAFETEVFYPVKYRGADDPPTPMIISHNHDSILLEKYKKQRFTHSKKTLEEIKNYVHDYYPSEKDMKLDKPKLFDSEAWANRHEVLYKYKYLLKQESNSNE